MNKQVLLLYFTVFINIISFGMIFPILPLFAESFHATAFDIAMIAAVFSLAQFFISPIIGRVSDRFGRKPILIGSLLGSIFSFVIMTAAQNLAMIYLARIIHGISSAGNYPVAAAYIADITKKEERAQYMGKISAIFSIGFIFGPVFGGFLGGLGYQITFITAALVSILNLLFVFFLLPESISKKAEKLVLREGLFNFKQIYHGLRGDFGALFFVLFVWAFYISNFQVAIPLISQETFRLSTTEIGIFFAVTGAAAAATQWFVLPFFTSRFGDIKTIFIGLLLMIAGQIAAPFSSSIILFTLLFTVSISGSGFTRPTANAVLSKATHTGQGATLGLSFSFESLGRVIGPLIAGFSISRLGLRFPFWMTAAVLVAGLIIFHRIEMRKQA